MLTCNQISILRHFDFEPALQRMSVITTNPTSSARNNSTSLDDLRLFVKGSPEAIRSLSNPKTVPNNFDEVLKKYTQDGLYVLACAYRPLYSLKSALKGTEIA